MRLFMATLAVAFFMSPAHALYVITDDLGGIVDSYHANYQRIKREGARIVVDGPCQSACTMLLDNPRACATPRAVFGFHSSFTVRNGRVVNPRDKRGNAILFSHYPARVRAFIARNGGLTGKMIYVPGQSLLPAC